MGEEIMSVYQQVFSIFYAILFGAMLASLEPMRAFPWGFPAEKNHYIKRMLQRRLYAGLLSFNILPICVYALGLWLLSGKEGQKLFHIDYCYMFFVALSALSVFMPYRVYHLLFILVFRKWHGNYAFYPADEYFNIIKIRSVRETTAGNVMALIFYFLLLFFPNVYHNFAIYHGSPVATLLTADILFSGFFIFFIE